MPVPVWSLVITAALPGVFTAVGEVVKCKTGPDRCPGVKRSIIPNEAPSAKMGFAPFFSRVARRQEDDPAVGPCGIAQFEFDRCQADASAIVVQTSIPAPGVAQFDNVPATCLNLATALTGGCGVEGPFPVICGSACVKWEGLTQDQFIELSGYLTDGEA